MKKNAYISGPITGMPNLNRHKFHAAEELLSKHGLVGHNPHKFPADHDKSWAAYMKVCIPVLSFCDCVYVIDGWKKSRGAVWEVAISEMFGLPVYSLETMTPVKLSFYLKLKMILNLI